MNRCSGLKNMIRSLMSLALFDVTNRRIACAKRINKSLLGTRMITMPPGATRLGSKVQSFAGSGS